MPEGKKEDVAPSPTMNVAKIWKFAYAALFIVFIITAALNMLRVRAGFLTNYAADIVVPAWLYIVIRGLHSPRRASVLTRYLGARPEVTALTLFVASALTEASQFYWPKGIFAGRFDPGAILAYASGIAICYVFDKNRGDKELFCSESYEYHLSGKNHHLRRQVRSRHRNHVARQ